MVVDGEAPLPAGPQKPVEARRPLAHAILLFTLWRHPRMASGFLFSFVVLLLFHLACAPFAPLPGEARFMPFFLLGPLAAIVVGPSAVWSAPAASMMADLLRGSWTDASWFVATGEAMAALHVFVFWDSVLMRRRPAMLPVATWLLAFRFLALCLPAGFIMVTWSALGAELFGNHAFGYVAFLESVQVVVFGCLLAPVLYRVAARDFAGLFGGWREVMGQGGRTAHWRPAGLVFGNVLALGLLPWLFAYGMQLTGVFPWDAGRLGLQTGSGFAELAVSLLTVHVAFLLWPD